MGTVSWPAVTHGRFPEILSAIFGKLCPWGVSCDWELYIHRSPVQKDL